MTEKLYKMMLLRRKFYKRMVLVGILFTVSFYGSVFLFGDIKSPRVMKLTSLERCPVCYGVSVCPELYSQQIILDSLGWSSMFNAKNIYHGYTRYDRRVVLKMLAHDWELRDLDANLCKTFDLESNCKPADAVDIPKLLMKIDKIVAYNLTWPETAPRKGLVMCPYSYSFLELVQPLVQVKSSNIEFDWMYIWTMLMVNPEPIIIQLMPKSRGWPVPGYGGVCGRLELVAYEGEPISSLMHLEWRRKLKFAKGILSAAMDFTFKHDRFRFYPMDWSLDNIVANELDAITFVDLEDVIILDKHTSPHDLPLWYKRHMRENLTGSSFSFSIDQICRHHLSDHNIWAACHVLAGGEEPLLYPLPDRLKNSEAFGKLLKECLNGDNRFRTVVKLQHVVNEMLADVNMILP